MRGDACFQSEDQVVETFKDYYEICVGKEKYPTLAGFAVYCNINKLTLSRYGHVGHEFYNAMSFIKTMLEDNAINCNMTDGFKKFYMVNTFADYKDKQDVVSDNINRNVDIVLSDSERERLMSELKAST